MNSFEETLQILKSKVQLRKLLQDTQPDDIQRIINRIDAIYQEKQIVALEQEQALLRKKEALGSITAQMKSLGVTFDDLCAATSPNQGKKRSTAQARQRFVFAYQDAAGHSKKWEGAATGRIPSDFADYLERTKKTRKACIESEL